MVHIVFNESELDLMKQVMELDESMAGEVVLIRDDFAVGPLAALDTDEGWQARTEWWKARLAGSPYGEDLAGSFDDRQTVANLKTRLEETQEEEVWIWMGQNQHDVCGYFWLMPQLREYQGRVMVLYMNNLPFINEKGSIFYPEWLHTIPPKEFLKAKKLARPITLSEFEVDPDEWAKLCNENKAVRILEGGKKLVQYDYDFYDSDLGKYISKDWQKAHKVIAQFLSKNKHTTGDAYLLWRLKMIIADNDKYDVQGEVKHMKDFEIKLKLGNPEIINIEE